MSANQLMREIRSSRYLSNLYDQLSDADKRSVFEMVDGDPAKLKEMLEFATEGI